MMTLSQITAFRRELHAHPEVSCEEYETQKRILALCNSLDVPHVEPIGKTGVLASFKGEVAGPTVLFRSDTDALPIEELNEDLGHASRHKGVSHKCGHDGHSASLIGVANLLLKEPPKRGTILLLFQPAEENGEGAKAVLADKVFEKYQPDFVYAYHNLPGYPLHQIVYKPGMFTAAAKSIIVKLHGRTSHAAEPEEGINPALAISEVLQLEKTHMEADWFSEEFFLITPIHVNMGEKAYGISAGYGEVHLTVRAFDNAVMAKSVQGLVKSIEEVALKHGLEASIEFTQEFSANENDGKAVNQIIEASEKLKLSATERKVPFKWGEDFGLFTERYRGAMFGIGSGEDCPVLHDPYYDFPDEILETGMNMFFTLAKKHCY